MDEISDPAVARALAGYRRANWRIMLLGLVAVVGFIAVASVLGSNADSFLRNGRRTDAVVTSTDAGVRTSGSFTVDYRAAGREYRERICCDDASYEIGEHVTVYYSPDEPSRVRTRADDNTGAWPLVAGFLLGAGGLGLVGGFIGLRRSRKLVLLARQGQWKPGWITSAKFHVMTGATELSYASAASDEEEGSLRVSGTAGARARFLQSLRGAPGQAVLVCTAPNGRVALAPTDCSVILLARSTAR